MTVDLVLIDTGLAGVVDSLPSVAVSGGPAEGGKALTHEHVWSLRHVEFDGDGSYGRAVQEFGCTACDAVDFR